jgi:hypothetical protein
MSAQPTLEITDDFTEEFNRIVGAFKKDAVLVGIPEEKSSREDQEGHFGNAAILALNHFGSEEAHIPPRPVLSIGIKNAQKEIADRFKEAAKEALSKGIDALTKHYEQAGTIAASACKRVINDQEGLEPPSPATLKARQYLTDQGFKGTKSLLVTGQVRNAITYVVRSSWLK